MWIEEQKEELVDMTWQDILKEEKQAISLEEFIEKRISEIKQGHTSGYSQFYRYNPPEYQLKVDLSDNHGNLQVRAFDKLKEMGIKIDDYIVDIPSSKSIIAIYKGTLGGYKGYSDYFDDEHGFDSIDPNRLVE
tara:strand:+ start:4633 stop:5034 length:402 start_codon:yes stop_codon:yes gene_type:complete